MRPGLVRAAGGVRTALGAAALSIMLAGTPACAFQADDPAASRAAAATALRTGRYDDALARLQRLAALPAGDAQARAADRRQLLRTLLTVGHYEEAERLARQYVAEPDGALVATAAGEVLLARGKAGDAEPLLARAATGAPDSLTARLRLAELRLARGDRAAAMRDFDAFIDVYRNAQGRLTSEQLAAVAGALRHLGRANPQLYKDALRVYDEAVAADSANLDARVRLGELFLEKYNGPEAASTLGAVLRVNPRHPAALVAAARQAYEAGEGDPRALLRRALETNPDYPPAHALLARLALDLEDHATARAEAERALTVDPAEAEALAVLAATHHFGGDAAGFDAVRRRAEAQGLAAADFYVTLADLSARSRLYADAVTFAGRAVAVDSAAARALALLGVNLLRTGDAAAARQALEAGFARDPY
ncbi:MAG TPA: tetratricopeptide repeat protein, partial [Gemmatimonadaceae bacterium]|nr:tetratricopeptide repeat protein [Gemmatimonadaceae bacterium]